MAKISLECIIIAIALGLFVVIIAAIIACIGFPMYFGIILYLLYACVTGKFCRDGCKETMKQMLKNLVSIVICNT